MNIKYLAGCIMLIAGLQPATCQIAPHQGPSVDLSHGRLVVSGNNRFLQFEDGAPFFYLGDTGWEFFHRLNFSEAETYLENRRQKGFTVIQAVILAERDGLNTPNRNGDRPLIDNDPAKPNEAYFLFVDSLIRLAESKGIFIGLLPTWGDKVDRAGWGLGPVIFTPENAFGYGKYLGSRYKSFPNIIWINGGDRSGGIDASGKGNNFPVWDALGKGIKSADQNHLMTYHPWGEKSSSEWFHGSDWLDFNMAQTGHGQRSYAIYRMIRDDYNRTPVKPCMDGEPRYEDHPINWRPDSLGWFNEMHIRQAAYWNLFTGALGHTYGCHPVWQMAAPGSEFVGYARHYWYEVLDLPGAWQMLNVRRLMESRPVLNRVPFQELVLNPGDEYTHIAATKGDSYLMVYTPLGNKIELNGNLLPASSYQVSWYDPRSGKTLQAGKAERKPLLEFSAPSRGPGFDWILILDEIK
ncbi:MAG TPA: glycoside hydrolase family 140 protein [Bacteroidales bacterium]|nr:glycoside hydrolase family 140 protein [Bacteroidales bacterium]